MEYINLSTGNNAEDTYVLKYLNKIFLKKRGYTFTLPDAGSSVILLLSGGLDSICLWYLLLKKYRYDIYPLHIRFNRRGSQPEKAIKYYSSLFLKQFPSLFHAPVNINDLNMFTFSEINNKDLYIKYPSFAAQNTLSKNDKTSVVINHINNPSRLGFYSFHAYDFAQKIRFKDNINVTSIFLGIVPDDNLMRESTLTTLRSVNLTFCTVVGDYMWQIAAPIDKKNNFYYSKKDLIRFAHKNKVPLEKTWSCNFSGTIHCGTCFDCYTRRKAFIEAGVTDQTKYAQEIKKIISTRLRIPMIKNLSLRMPSMQKMTVKKTLIKDSVRIFVSPDTNFYEVEKNLTLSNERFHMYKSFNSSGSKILKFIIKKPRLLKEINSFVMNEYDIKNRQTVYEDINSFIRENIQEGYLTILD